jgi:O-antigen ligase
MKALSGVVLFVALAAVALSKSRGGGLTILVVVLAAVVIGFRQWPERARRTLQLTAFGFVILAVVGFVFLSSSYVTRFEQHFGWSSSDGRPLKERIYLAKEMLRDSSRGLMFAGAIRAWHSQPVWGIGPGMHQNLWPHFAASPDGDRESGTWPTRPCDDFHSYEVHNDWLQLLEEYGIVGMVLFFAAFITVITLLWTYYRMKATDIPDHGVFAPDCGFAMVLAALFAIAAMAFHSLGDFNLQIPANTWMLAVIVGMPLGRLVRHK